MVAAWLTPPGTPPHAGSRATVLGMILLGAAVALAIFALFSGTTVAMVSTWYESNSFNHCFLILPISAYLAWQKRGALAQAAIVPDWRGGVVMVGAALGWLVGDVAGALVIQQASLILALQALVLMIYGRAVFRILLFPLLYLFFAVPFGLEFIPPLQTVTAILSVALLKLVGVPVFSDGYFISIPNGNWFVADACSGVRYVISSLALGALFAGTMYVTWWRRALVMAISVVVPILANGVRAFGIILIAYVSDNELATGIDHIIYGWLFFTLVSCCVLALGMVFRETQPDTSSLRAAAPHAVSLRACVLAALVALVTVGSARAYSDYLGTAGEKRAIDLHAPTITGYQSVETDNSQILPRFPNTDAQLDAGYREGIETVYLRVGYYANERRGVRAVNLDYTLPGSTETITAGKGKIDARIGDTPIAVRYERVTAGNRGRVIWYWYWVDGRLTGDAYLAKLYEAKAKLLGGGQPAAVIALAVDYRGDPALAENALRAFMLKSEPLYAALTQAQLPSSPQK